MIVLWMCLCVIMVIGGGFLMGFFFNYDEGIIVGI